MILRLGVFVALLALPQMAAAADGHHGGFSMVAYAATVINFLLLLLILNKLGGDSFTTFLKNRRAQIENEIHEARRLKEAAEAKAKEYAARLAKLDHEIDALKAEMVHAGEVERDRILAEASQKAERMKADAQFLIDQQIRQLRIDLTKETATAAVKVAEELLLSSATPSDQERLAKDYVARVAALPRGKA